LSAMNKAFLFDNVGKVTYVRLMKEDQNAKIAFSSQEKEGFAKSDRK
jgi:hypothetical protein